MNMGPTNGQGMQWMVAGAISLGLHAVVLCLFALSGMSDAKPPSCVPGPDETPSVTETRPEPAEEPAAPVPKAEQTVEPRPAVEKPAVEKPVVEKKVEPATPVKRTPPPKALPAEKPGKDSKPANPPGKVSAGGTYESYVVKKGDSLTQVAKRYDCTPAGLAKLNGVSLKKLANLKIGQKIKVPKKGE